MPCTRKKKNNSKISINWKQKDDDGEATKIDKQKEAYFLASFMTKTGDPGTSAWTCRKSQNIIHFCLSKGCCLRNCAGNNFRNSN